MLISLKKKARNIFVFMIYRGRVYHILKNSPQGNGGMKLNRSLCNNASTFDSYRRTLDRVSSYYPVCKACVKKFEKIYSQNFNEILEENRK